MLAEAVASLRQIQPTTGSAPRSHRKHHEEREKNKEKTYRVETTDLASVSCEIGYA
jgi:hypothetical protein